MGRPDRSCRLDYSRVDKIREGEIKADRDKKRQNKGREISDRVRDQEV